MSRMHNIDLFSADEITDNYLLLKAAEKAHLRVRRAEM